MMNRKQMMAGLVLSLAVQGNATEGVNLIGVGPVQQGTAGAGVASAKDSTWLILNPAGLTDVRRGVDSSFQYFAPSRTINSTASGGAGTQRDDSGFVIPSISASFGCCRGESGYFGIGIYGTSGMGVDYDRPRLAWSGGDTKTELAITKLTLTYAQAFNNGFSIGAGPVLVLSRFRTNMETSRIGPPSVPADGSWDGAVGAGAILGVNQKIGDRLRIGAGYMSEQFMTEFDEYDNLLNDSLNLPQQVTVGLAADLRKNLELALDYRWIGWNKLDTLGDQFGWKDQRIVKAGLTWGATDRLTLRGGISHGNSPISKQDVFANALFPAIMKTHLACGASYEFNRFALHFAYIHALKEEMTDSNAPAAGGGTKISMVQNSATLGVSWRF